ncbi:tRNA (cytosine(34)-C(5))-methyltransferase, mitochondrial isoform X2 [Vombatus ursinus]|uniref:tRNA (cytosine(34)-C(5))-methyltransferase, mitochondrial isoform X2 n=1 Tax=Vombatus ursinus TaxID=29139 RepID=UPI000FFD996F|nr:tRNA (cytosine(34)-C(5))-methyltransferase, mitochondrial isoform X2 [Vombatus ursinus]
MVLSRLKPQSERKLTKQICRVVLDHFEKQYVKELGDSWITIRDILTSPACWQHAVLFNRFNYPFELEKDLQLKRYHPLLQGYFPNCPKSLICYVNRIPGRIPSERHQFGYFHCNEYDSLRSRWLKQTLESFIPQPMTHIIKVSELDGREIGDTQPEMFDKVLVDAPCSNDRSWLFSSDTQKASYRLNQRKELPLMQIELLRSAIRALRPGGSLVYSTCTLSKAENIDVVDQILNSHSNIIPVDMKEMASAVSHEFTFAPNGQEYGLLVLPDKGKAWGPMFVAKLNKSVS